MAAPAKRMRKVNFSSCEVLALIEAYSADKTLLQSKLKSSVTNADKQRAWEKVTDAVNAVSTVGRSIAEIKEKWSKLASDARVQLRARKNPPTGSGKSREMPFLDLMDDIFGESVLIDGIEGGIDTGDADVGLNLQQEEAEDAGDSENSTCIPSREDVIGFTVDADEDVIIHYQQPLTFDAIRETDTGICHARKGTGAQSSATTSGSSSSTSARLGSSVTGRGDTSSVMGHGNSSTMVGHRISTSRQEQGSRSSPGHARQPSVDELYKIYLQKQIEKTDKEMIKLDLEIQLLRQQMHVPEEGPANK